MIPVRAVLFDYGLVLSGPPDPAAWEQLKTLLHADENAFHAAYWKYRDAYDRGALTAEAYFRAVAAELQQDLDRERLTRLIAADTALWTQPNADMMVWAQALQRAGIKTGILSNIGDAMELGVLARFPLLNEFSHHTFSHRLGIAKPDRAIYEHAIQGLGVPTAEILFVDDREDNIAAARAVGMQTVQYTGHHAFVREIQRMGLGSLLLT